MKKKYLFALISPKTLQYMYVHYINLPQQQQQSLYIHCYFKTPFDDDVYHIFFFLFWGLIHVMAIE